MIKNNCPRSGLAQRWAPRLRTTFIVLLCFVILTLSLPLGAFASSGTQMYDYNGVELPYSSFIDSYSCFILYSYSKARYQLYYVNSSSLQYVYANEFSITSSKAVTIGCYYFNDTSWVYSSSDGYSNSTPSIWLPSSENSASNAFKFIWCNFDIYNQDGSEIVFHSVEAVPVQTQSTEYFITSENNVNQLYTGESLQLYCQTTEGLQAESVSWSIQNVSDYTGLSISSSGLFSVSSDTHSIGNVTVQASDINGTYTYTTFELTIFEGENLDSGGGEGGEGGDTPTPTPIPDASNQDIVDSLDDGFKDITDKIDTASTNIVDKLLEGIKKLFVPSAEELSAKIDDFKAWIEEKLPLLNIPISVVSYIYDMFFGVKPDAALIDFPEVSWMGEVLIEETSLDLTQYSWLNDVLPIIRTLLTAGCALAFINWIMKKIQGVASA